MLELLDGLFGIKIKTMKAFLSFMMYQIIQLKLATKLSIWYGTAFWGFSNFMFWITKKLNAFLDIPGIKDTPSMFERAYNWYLYNDTYVVIMLGTIAVDHALGTWKYLNWRKFDFKKNVGGLFTKIFIVIMGAWLFEAMGGIIHKDSIFKDWLLIVTRLLVFIYPAYSAWKSMSVITKGAFPPKSWIERIERFKGGDYSLEAFRNGEKETGDELP